MSAQQHTHPLSRITHQAAAAAVAGTQRGAQWSWLHKKRLLTLLQRTTQPTAELEKMEAESRLVREAVHKERKQQHTQGKQQDKGKQQRHCQGLIQRHHCSSHLASVPSPSECFSFKHSEIAQHSCSCSFAFLVLSSCDRSLSGLNKHFMEALQASDTCAVCLEPIEAKQTVRLLPPCRHIFHGERRDFWLKQRVKRMRLGLGRYYLVTCALCYHFYPYI